MAAERILRTETVGLVLVQIGTNADGCGHSFYMTQWHYEETMRTKRGWYCPVCGISRVWKGKSEEAKLKEELAAEQKRREWHERNAANERAAREKSERSAPAIRGAATRTRNRIKNGVCPCCNRTFSNLLRHMGTEHPEFNPGAVITGETPPSGGAGHE
jgi:hypothetical protein